MAKVKKVFFPIFIVFCDSIYFYLICRFRYQNGWLIPKSSVTRENLSYVILFNVLSMWPLVIGLLIFYRKKLGDLGIKKSAMASVLLGIYFLFFIRNKNFELAGIYNAIFYLAFVAIPEEIIYRGYLYLQLKKWNRTGAVIISGMMFGYMHALLPGIVNQISAGEMVIQICSELGGGIVLGMIFIGFYELSGSLLVPILIHALFDDAWGLWGFPVIIAAFAYLYRKRRKGKTGWEK